MTRNQTQTFMRELSKYLVVEKCRACECLLGGLAQIRKDRPEFREDVDRLLKVRMHRCLECVPCPPAESWLKYLKRNRGNA